MTIVKTKVIAVHYAKINSFKNYNEKKNLGKLFEPFWLSPSVDSWISKSCNFLILCPILFKLSLVYINN